MRAPPDQGGLSCQARFHRRWGHLRDPDVRALAWLLDAPGLLDPDSGEWQGQVAMLPDDAAQQVAGWLAELDRDPAALKAHLAVQPFTRLGRYAERLMAFYFAHRQMLVAFGVQVRSDKGDTIGEFDFLLRSGKALVHWEFATKLYLLEAAHGMHGVDYFVGPNLADTLGIKMRKIFGRQLLLSQHPAAQAVLPEPVEGALALIKGWLFYARHGNASSLPAGVAPDHCRGFWCTVSELDDLPDVPAVILPRLRWLAPLRCDGSETMDRTRLRSALSTHFGRDTAPVLLALMRADGGDALEFERGFIVPDDWQKRAEQRISASLDVKSLSR